MAAAPVPFAARAHAPGIPDDPCTRAFPFHSAVATAQEGGGDPQQVSIQELLRRIDAQDARIEELEQQGERDTTIQS
ncbi:MAG: hypothetical protein IPM29_27100 [Planctomycetes bacterium]|nr:hypothetical protein [Planctomycetota bacterium]